MTEKRRNRIESVLKMRQSNLAVVLEDIDDKHNLYASLRNCDAVGVQNVYIIDPRKRTFEAGRKSSSSAKRWLSVHYFTNTKFAFEEIRKSHDKILVTNLSETAKSIFKTDFKESMAIVFGNEQIGVSDTAIELSDGNIVIPQNGMIKSLNLSVSVAVTLYEAFRQRGLMDAESNAYGFNDDAYNNLYQKWIEN